MTRGGSPVKPSRTQVIVLMTPFLVPRRKKGLQSGEGREGGTEGKWQRVSLRQHLLAGTEEADGRMVVEEEEVVVAGAGAAGGAGSHLCEAKQWGAIKPPSAAGSVQCEDGLQHASFHLPHEDPGNAMGVVKVERKRSAGPLHIMTAPEKKEILSVVCSFVTDHRQNRS